MSKPIFHFYASGNTSQGFVSVLDSTLQDIERLFIVQGKPGSGRSGIINEIASRLSAYGSGYRLIHSPFDNDSIDALLLPELKTAIVTDTAAAAVPQNKLPAIIHTFDLNNGLDDDKINLQQHTISLLTEQIEKARKQAYDGFAQALRIHDDWEAIYISNMDFQAADDLTAQYIQLLFGNKRLLNKSGLVERRFLGAATPRGAVDFVPNLTDGLNRYFIKGRAGSGKSTFLKKLAAEGVSRGFDIELYQCGFDPNSLDMVISRELCFAIFDSTAPHEYFPDRQGDEIVDMYTHCITPGTDEKHADEIQRLKSLYTAKMKESIQHLATSQTYLDELKQIYVDATDLNIVEKVKNEIFLQLDRIAFENA